MRRLQSDRRVRRHETASCFLLGQVVQRVVQCDPVAIDELVDARALLVDPPAPFGHELIRRSRPTCDVEARSPVSQRSIEVRREPEPLEVGGVEEGVDGGDASTCQLEHLERPGRMAAGGVDAVLGERRATVGLAPQQP